MPVQDHKISQLENMAYLNNSVNDNLNNLTFTNIDSDRLSDHQDTEYSNSQENPQFNSELFDMLVNSPQVSPKKIIDASSLEKDIFCENNESISQNTQELSESHENSPIISELP